jgi:hypothetical protein
MRFRPPKQRRRSNYRGDEIGATNRAIFEIHAGIFDAAGAARPRRVTTVT